MVKHWSHLNDSNESSSFSSYVAFTLKSLVLQFLLIWPDLPNLKYLTLFLFNSTSSLSWLRVFPLKRRTNSVSCAGDDEDCCIKASWFVRKFCNSSNDGWLVHLWMDMINGEYSFFKPLMMYLHHLASLIFSLGSSSEISAQRFLIFKKYSTIVRLPCTVDASSFSSNYNRATFLNNIIEWQI